MGNSSSTAADSSAVTTHGADAIDRSPGMQRPTRREFDDHLGRTGGHFREVHHDVADPRIHEVRQLLSQAEEELNAYLPADHDECMIVSQLTQHDGRPGRGHGGHIERGCGWWISSGRHPRSGIVRRLSGVRHRFGPSRRVSVARGNGTPHAGIRQERRTARPRADALPVPRRSHRTPPMSPPVRQPKPVSIKSGTLQSRLDGDVSPTESSGSVPDFEDHAPLRGGPGAVSHPWWPAGVHARREGPPEP